jgi:hypothetical protein
MGSGGCRGRGGEAVRAVEREEIRGPVRFRLRSELRPPRGTLGDRITWRLEADLPRDAAPGGEVRGPTPATLELDKLAPPDLRRQSGRLTYAASFTLRGYDLGPIPLPSFALVIRRGAGLDTLEFPNDTLYVDSLTQAASGINPPPRGPIPTELRPIDWVVLTLGALLALGALIWVIRSLRRGSRRASEVASPTTSPEERLRAALDALRVDAAALPRDLFYERLSDALREYVAAVTGVPAIDRTTSELDRELGAHPSVSPSTREGLVRLLGRADLAKFARTDDPAVSPSQALDEATALAARLAPTPSVNVAAPAAGGERR